MKTLFLKTLTVCVPILLCAFTACETTKDDRGKEMLPFNAILGLGGPIRFKADFLKANRLDNGLYLNENGEWEWELDKTLPNFRTFIITEKAQLDEIFSVYPEVDFEKDMVVMYAYLSTSSDKDKLISITLNNKNLKIEFTTEMGKPGYGNAHSPQPSFLPIKMDRLDIDTVEFTWIHPSLFRIEIAQI